MHVTSHVRITASGLLAFFTLAATAPQTVNNNTNPPMMAKNASGTLGTIERLDPALDELLAPDAKLEVLVQDVQWAEGPVWFDGGLLFSDVPQNTMYRWTREQGVTVYLKPSGYNGATPRGGEPGSNGLTLDLDGRVVMCQHGNRRVARLEKDGKTVSALADQFEGKHFNSPNDLCFDSHGNLYFTDPSYGLEKRDADPKKELPNSAYLRRTDGSLVRLATGTIRYGDGTVGAVRFPNGIALSPDEKSLYFCVSDPQYPVILKYDVQPDGNIANGRIFFDATKLAAMKRPGVPDGMKLDTQGNVWSTGPGGLLIITPQGKHLGTILTGVATANCGWGDDGSTLYIWANHNVCRIKTRTKGVMPGPK